MSCREIIHTHNGLGWTSSTPNQITVALRDDLGTAVDENTLVLDLGAGLGVGTIPLLRTGATVIANDLEQSHLDIIRRKAEEGGCGERLQTCCGSFPDGLEFKQLDAIHCSNVLHFLSGAQIGRGAAKMYEWLRPGGRVYVQVGTIYAGHIRRLRPVFDKRRKEGMEWAGETHAARSYVHPDVADITPPFMNYLDGPPVVRAFEAAGFSTVRAWYYTRSGLPEIFVNDGREHFGYVGDKGQGFSQ